VSTRAETKPYAGRLLQASLAHGLFGTSIGLLVLLPVYLRELGASHAYAGLVTGVAFGVGLCIRPPTGWALDHFGRRPVVILGGVFVTAGAALYPFAEGIGLLMYLARVLSGVAAGMLLTGLFTYAADVVPPERRAHGLALFGISGLLPQALAPALGEWIVQHGGFGWLFRLSIVTGALSLAVAATLPETLERSRPPPPMVSGIARVVAARPLLGVWLLMSAFGVGLASTQVFVAPTTLERAHGPARAFFVAYGVAAVLVRVLASGLADRLGPARIVAPALFIYGVGLAVLSAAASPLALVVSGAAGGIGHGLLYPAASAMVVDRAPAEQRGAALAAMTGIVDLSYFAASPGLGWIGDVRGGGALFATAALAVLGGLVAFRRAEKGARPTSLP
jgi:MFS family permease